MMKGLLMNDLLKNIYLINDEYEKYSCEWEQLCYNNDYPKINLNKFSVKKILLDEVVYNIIQEYKNFMNNINDDISKSLTDIIYRSRVKDSASIQQKITKYSNKPGGSYYIGKCLNDIYGLRILIDGYDLNEVYEFLKENLDERFKITKGPANQKTYKAIHVYFGENNNKRFKWELQIWDERDEQSNIESHAKYKQDYIKWSKEFEEGGIDNV